ncbi:MAG: hypothetical protein LAT62_11020 [Natronospirillum sp.]|uniref:hypothetical protein n=1 Tax=Natronospirillum sp. TaxID=2812955 RepID=UPI0025E19073|nr:hypothetical protein [Natronospirillum sp.]MCH8552460.1 hypothetical protein [Natronospirillum sp.]
MKNPNCFTRPRPLAALIPCLLTCLLAYPSTVGANPVIAVDEDDPPALFNRLQLRGGGVVIAPEEDLVGIGYQLGLAGYWMLAPWAALELGGQHQSETLTFESDSEYRVTQQTLHYGGRLLWPTERVIYGSAAARWYRGRLSVDDTGSEFSGLRVAYNWYEAGLHAKPQRSGTEAGITLRYYEWANDDDQWTVTGEWLLPGREWSLGLDGEVAIDQDFFQVGVSANRRF